MQHREEYKLIGGCMMGRSTLKCLSTGDHMTNEQMIVKLLEFRERFGKMKEPEGPKDTWSREFDRVEDHQRMSHDTFRALNQSYCKSYRMLDGDDKKLEFVYDNLARALHSIEDLDSEDKFDSIYAYVTYYHYNNQLYMYKRHLMELGVIKDREYDMEKVL